MRSDVATTPVQELELKTWSAKLRRISSAPLELKPDFPLTAKRFEAWWAHDCIDRPLFLAIANTNPSRPMLKRLDLLDKPDVWFAEKLIDLKQKHWVGDTLPNIRVDFGPVMLSGLLGGRTDFTSDTTWTSAFINDDWSNAPSWQIDQSHPFWRQLTTLAQKVARHCAGKYVLCTPDLGGSGDVLMNLRGPDNLCMDTYENPERIRAALDAIYFAWRKALHHLYSIAMNANAPIFHWLGVWSDVPHMIPACDFNYLIGPREFESLFLPDIERQAKTVGRAVFHLDGPGAARHIDSLLEVDAIDAIQFTPGAGDPSILRWIPMFQKIQARGRSVLAVCPSGEIDALCDAVKPEGLCIMLADAPTPADLDALFERFRKRFGAKS